ncbi:MAG: hypothetical protein NC191_07170 [Muribaculaceae bacterium]|nr:hypothetical protein [Muribaculaceae bacterium]
MTKFRTCVYKMRQAGWGIPWRKASGNPELAIKTLMENQRGFIPNVFDKQGIGEFDIPWGTKKYGLAHALEGRANQKNFDLNNFIDTIPNSIREGIVTQGGKLHPETLNIESLKHKLAINANFKQGNIDRNWVTTIIPQNKQARKRLGDLTPPLNISSENGSITPSISKLLAKDNINEFLHKSNPADWLNSELSTAARSSANLIKNENSQNPQPHRFQVGIEQNVTIPKEKIFTPDEIGKMSQEEFNNNEHAIRTQLQRGLITPNTKDYSGFKNPWSGSNKIYTQEDIGRMSFDEYNAAESEINAQWGSVGIPSDNEMKSNSSAIYVNGYTRADGTEVRGYYRSR